MQFEERIEKKTVFILAGEVDPDHILDRYRISLTTEPDSGVVIMGSEKGKRSVELTLEPQESVEIGHALIGLGLKTMDELAKYDGAYEHGERVAKQTITERTKQ